MFGALDNHKEKETVNPEGKTVETGSSGGVEQAAKQNGEAMPATAGVENGASNTENVSSEVNIEQATLEPSGAEIEPAVSSEVANAGIEVKHERKEEANLQETAASLSSQALEPQSAPAEARVKSEEIFPPVLSTGNLGKGDGAALNNVEERRFSLLRFAKIPKITLPKIMGGSKVSDSNKHEPATVNK